MWASIRQLQAAVCLCLLIHGPFKALIMSVVYFHQAQVPGDCHTLVSEKIRTGECKWEQTSARGQDEVGPHLTKKKKKKKKVITLVGSVDR